MTWVAVAVVGGAAVGAIGSNMAAGKQASGQQAAANTQRDMFNTITQQEQPFIQPGYAAESTLSELMGLPSSGYAGAPAPTTSPTYAPSTPSTNTVGGSALSSANLGGWTMGGDGRMMQLIPNAPGSSAAPSVPAAQPGTVGTTGLPPGYLTQTFNPTQQQLENYPGYQFQLNQGDLALQNANSVGGSALSGSALKNLMTFNQGLAASNYGNYFNQFQTQQTNIFNRLSAIASLGQNAAGNLGNAGTQLGTGIAGAQAAAAGSMAGGIVGATNSIGNNLTLAGLMQSNQANPYVTPQGTIAGGGGSTIDAGGGYNFSY